MALHKHKQPQSAGIDPLAWGKTLILLGLGLYLTLLIATGSLNYYINQRFAWLVYVGAAIFFLLALVSFWQSWRRPAGHYHQNYEISWDILLVAAFPLLLSLLIPARALGIEAVNGGVSLNPVGRASAAAFNRSPLDRNILDWLREFERAATPAAFNGQPVDVVGFVYREPHFDADKFMVARFTMSCCVADAFPIGLPAQFAAAADYEAGVWVRLRGQLQAGTFADEFFPIALVESIERVEQPEQPYLYP